MPTISGFWVWNTLCDACGITRTGVEVKSLARKRVLLEVDHVLVLSTETQSRTRSHLYLCLEILGELLQEPRGLAAFQSRAA